MKCDCERIVLLFRSPFGSDFESQSEPQRTWYIRLHKLANLGSVPSLYIYPFKPISFLNC